MLGVATLLWPVDSGASATRLAQWQNLYQYQSPYSQSAVNAQCALCHTVKSVPSGGAPWNGYAQALRQNGWSFAAVEQANSDGDPAGKSNIQEIAAGAQPGWRAGGNNAIYGYGSPGVVVVVGQIAAPSGIGSLDPPPAPGCSLSASRANPTVGTSVTLTASCSNNPTGYAWSAGAAGCSGASATCAVTAGGAGGPVIYTVTATNSGGTGSPASVTIDWQPQPVAAPVCTLSAGNLSPTVGTMIVLTASCSNGPTAYAWTGCASTTATCMASAATQGPVTYSVAASNNGGTGNRASVTANWQASLAGGPSLDQHGLTGSWYNPSTSGQGVEIEVYRDLVAPGIGFLQGAWFTYDHAAAGGAASQRWYTFSGNVRAGQSSETLTIYRNVGGNFNSLPVTSAVPVGSVVFSVTDCNHATMAYSFADGTGRSGTIAMVRLLPNVTCVAGGAAPTSPDFAYSGNWYESATSGQGIVMELNPNQPFVFFAWYTYAPNGQAQGAAGQRWYTGQASYTPGARTLPMTLYETTGGLFDSGAPTPNTVPVGTATATFTSCTALRLDFAFTGGSSTGSSGTINLSRVGPTPAGCGP